MPFESLSERLQMSLRRLTGRGKVNENDIDEIMKEVRVALLEADVTPSDYLRYYQQWHPRSR